MTNAKLLFSLGLVAALGACATDTTDDDDVYGSDGKDDSSWSALGEGPITYTSFVTHVFRLTSLTKQKAYLYLGTNETQQCTAAVTYSVSGSYTDAQFEVHETADDDDDQALVQVQSNAKLSIKKLARGELDFNVIDKTCYGLDDVDATYADDTADPRTLSQLHTTSRSRDCISSKPLVERQRSCGHLKYVFSPTASNLSKVATLLKADLPASDPASKRITSGRFWGCFLFLHEHGNLACRWDVSDDPNGGDDGDIQYGLYKLEAGVPTSLIKTWTGDKYTGDIGDP
jgi:hypothetical protein